MGKPKESNSVASRLAAMRHGDSEIFVDAPGISKQSKQAAIASALHKMFGAAKIEFSTQTALLIIDETEPPIPVVLVRRKKPTE